MPTPPFDKQTQQADPYQHYRFRVQWNGRYVAGVSKVGGLTRTTQVVTHRAGGDPSTPRKMPGQTEYGPITLERGVTHDVPFQQWANKVWDYGNATSTNAEQDISLADFRKTITIELYNEAGQKVLAYTVHRCWVSEFTAMPELDSSTSAVAIQSITLQNEGWDREDFVVTPPAPIATDPGS